MENGGIWAMALKHISVEPRGNRTSPDVLGLCGMQFVLIMLCSTNLFSD